MSTYWHELPPYVQTAILGSEGMTLGEFMEDYKQPPWCRYPDALEGIMGCWSLMCAPSKVKDRNYCLDCDLSYDNRRWGGG